MLSFSRTSSHLPRAALVGLCLLLSLPVAGQELETERWQVPMRVDRTDVTTDMLIEFSFERLEAPIADTSDEGNADRAAMLHFTESLVEGEVDEALELTAVPPGASAEDSRELLTAFSGMLGDTYELLRLERVVHLGPDRLLLWSLPVDDETRYFRSFRFVRDDQGALRYEGVASEPVSSLLTYTMQVGQDQGPDPRSPAEFDYEYTIPLTQEQPVRFRFDGVQLEVDAFNPLGQSGYPPLDFFNEAMSRLANASPQEYAELFTDFSEARYANWAAEQGNEAYEAYRRDLIQYGARVVFLMEAHPLYLVFYLSSDPDVQGSPLRYSAIYDNPESGLELTNFYVHGLADTVLQRREYFEEPFLRPLLASAGVIPAQPQPERVVVSGGDSAPPDPDEILAIVDAEAREGDSASVPLPADVRDLAGDSLPWPWIVLTGIVLALAAYALIKRK